jgi:hypothetical protein
MFNKSPQKSRKRGNERVEGDFNIVIKNNKKQVFRKRLLN